MSGTRDTAGGDGAPRPGRHPNDPGNADHANTDHGNDRRGDARHGAITRTVRLAIRLAAGNLRRRPGQALLLLLTLTMATGTMSLALSVAGSGDRPWDRVWRATDGFHVSVATFHDPDVRADKARLADLRRQLDAIAAEPGIVATGGPWPQLYGHMTVNGQQEDFAAEVRGPGRAPVDQPLVTAGRWLPDPGAPGTAGPGAGRAGEPGVVLENGLAATIRARPGDTVVLQGRRFAVRGIAMTVSQGRFPLTRPARVWVTPGDGRLLQRAGAHEEGVSLQLRLADPDRAEPFAARHQPLSTANDDAAGIYFETWRQRRADSHSDIDILATTLFGAGMLLAILTVATAAVLVAGRMAAQIRQVGTLKAVGVTPGQVTLVLLVEYLAVALVATAAGLTAGRLLAPAVTATSVTVLGIPEPPPLTLARVGAVAGTAVAVVLLATIRPALRAARRSTLRSLGAAVRPPRRPSRLARLSTRARLPLAGVLGLGSALRRPGRVLVNAAGLALGVAMVVVALSLAKSLERLHTVAPQPGHSASEAATEVLYGQIRTIVLVTAGLLLVLSAVNAFIVATFAARDSARNHALLRTVGATPRQTTIALVVSQLAACVLAVAAGIPGGIALFSLMDGGDLPPVRLPAATLVALGAAAPVLFAAIVAVPALLLARRPVTPLLAYE